MKLGQNVCLDKISDEFKMGHVGPKTRSLGQILEKPCVISRDFILVQILIKLGKNVCLDDYYDDQSNGSLWVKI